MEGELLGGEVAQCPLRVQLLGSFAVSVDGEVVEPVQWRRRKVTRLIALLALADGHTLHRELIQAQLWPEFSPEAAAQNLHHTLYRARRALERELAPRAISRFLGLREDLVVLAPPGEVEVDVERFEQAAARAFETGDPELHQAALDLHAGELLPAYRYEDWVIERAEQTETTLTRLLRSFAALELEAGRADHCIELLRRAAAAEPLNEEVHGELIEALGRAGYRDQVIAHFERFRAVVRRDLDTTPSPALSEIVDAVLSGRIGPLPRPTTGPSRIVEGLGNSSPVSSRPGPVLELPAPVSRFIGRATELGELIPLLAAERLVTLLGPGGVGKTRLAIALSSQLGQTRAGFVQLGEISNPDRVAGAVAAALRVSPAPGQPLEELLVSHLRETDTVLILDTCEHIRAGAGALAELLLERCPKVRVLATSRQSLGLVGEVLWQVPPLAVPTDGASLQDGRIADAEAVQLFLDRARRAQPGFELEESNAESVAQICQRLEGIPLAIELAAARLRVVPVAQLAERLKVRLPLLVGGSDVTTRRHRTLRATIEWSYDLLTPAARIALRRLAVFVGGWTLEAAEAVVPDSESDSSDVLDQLSELVDQSLVQGTLVQNASRYAMLDTVREFGLERLREAGELNSVRHRHMAYFLALAETMPGERFPATAIQTGWFERLIRDHGNLASALDWSLVSNADRELGLRLVHALRWYLTEQGRFEEGQRWLQPMLLEQHSVPTRLQAHTICTIALFTWRQGQYAQALDLALQALASFRELDDPWGLALATCMAGMLHQLQGDHAHGVPLTEDSLRRYRALRDAYGITWQLLILARAAVIEGDTIQAARLAKEGLELCRSEGHLVGEGWALAYLGLARETEGALAAAQELFREGLKRLSGGDVWGGALVKVALARATARLGGQAEAAAVAQSALADLGPRGSHAELGGLLHAFSVIAFELDAPRDAAQLIGTVDRLGAGGTVMNPNLVEADRQLLRSILGPAEYEAEIAVGQAADVNAAIATAVRVVQTSRR